MLNENADFDLKKTGIFFGLVFGAAIVTTILYWIVFGFDKWKTDIQSASNLMMAGTVVPPAQTNIFQPAQGFAPAQTAGQYICPVHGAVGLPRIDASGAPHCPICNQLMQFNSAQSNNFATAALQGGG